MVMENLQWQEKKQRCGKVSPDTKCFIYREVNDLKCTYDAMFFGRGVFPAENNRRAIKINYL